MRVLMVCTDAEIGGAERFLVSLANAKSPGDTVGLVVLMQPGSLSSQLEDAFDEVNYLGFAPSSRNLLGMVRGLERAARNFSPDVVSSHLFHADLITALARITAPKTTTVHTQGLTKSDHPLTRLIARAVGGLSFRFDAVIPAGASEQMAGFIRSLGMRNVVSPIRNGAAIPSQRSFSSGSRILLSLARNHPVKGHQCLFEAFAEVADSAPDWRLHAVGPGVVPDDERMRSAIREAGAESLIAEGRIKLLGPTDSPETALTNASALVISSIYGEAFPVVGAEAAGYGVPVITTDLGSCAEFADDKRFLVPPNDSAALGRAFRTYFEMSDGDRDELSARARKRAESEYDPRIAYERYRAVFAHLLARRGK